MHLVINEGKKSLRAKAKVEKDTVPSVTLQSTGEECPQYHLPTLMFY